MQKPPAQAHTPIRLNKIRLAAQGELVTCPSLHEICIVAQDIFEGETIRRENFTDWRQVEQLERIQDCQCGAPWVRLSTVTGKWQLHIGGEWRPVQAVQAVQAVLTQLDIPQKPRTFLEVFEALKSKIGSVSSGGV